MDCCWYGWNKVWYGTFVAEQIKKIKMGFSSCSLKHEK